MNSYTLVFLGTPDFSVPALLALHESRHRISLVITQPDRPKGRGRKAAPSPVKKTALALGYEVYQPSAVRSDATVTKIKALTPDFIITVAYGLILPSSILDIPKFASLNIHASLLPRYRGAAPIQRAIMAGEKQTGVTIMLMDTGLDTGDMLLQEQTPIHREDTAQTLHDRLAALGGRLILKTLEEFEKVPLTPIPQDDQLATYAEMLSKEDGHINWQLPANQIVDLIRGTTPWPGAFTYHQGRRFKLFKAVADAESTATPPGTVLKGFPGELRVATGKGILSILEIQGASGKRLSIQDFLRGHDVEPGTILT